MDDIKQLHEDFVLHSQADAENFKDIKDGMLAIRSDICEVKESLEPLTEAYSGFLFSKKFIVGFASVILAIGAIGAGIIWLVNSVVQK